MWKNNHLKNVIALMATISIEKHRKYKFFKLQIKLNIEGKNIEYQNGQKQ